VSGWQVVAHCWHGRLCWLSEGRLRGAWWLLQEGFLEWERWIGDLVRADGLGR
jgi:hypothetical protein